MSSITFINSSVLLPSCCYSRLGLLQPELDDAVRVYRWNNNGQQWDASRASGAEVSFYNSIDEDEAASQTKWVWHIQVGSLDTEVSQQFDYESVARRFRLTDANCKSWALVFSTSAALHSFVSRWEEKLFENTYKLQCSAENVDKVSLPHKHCNRSKLAQCAISNGS